MGRLLIRVREFLKPRKDQFLLNRWMRGLLVTLPISVMVNAVLRKGWFQNIGAALVSFCYALGDHAYFNVYGGTEKDYPNPPEKATPPTFR